MPRKTDSSNPADWIWISESDLFVLADLANRQMGYEICQSKLAEVIEKVLKAELIRQGWFLVKTHDLLVLLQELEPRDAALAAEFRSLVDGYATAYFTGRYPGFDLEDPDWPPLREHIAQVQALLAKVKARIV